MSDLATQAVQQAVMTLLQNDSTLGAQINGVFDHVPDKTSFPYIVLSETESRDWSTTTRAGQEHRMTLSVYSRYGGKKQVQQITERVYALLHEVTVSITGDSCVLCRFQLQEITLLNDGRTYQGDSVFLLRTQADLI